MNHLKTVFAVSVALLAGCVNAAPAGSVKNIVLVHGSFADGSGWQGVSKILKHDGFNVAVVQEPEDSLAGDAKAASRVIDLQPGPVILVGHSYGGAVITEAGNNPKVAGLVYIAAFQPDAGESVLDLNKRTPPASTAATPTADGYIYLDPAKFHADFCADLPDAQAEFMASSQVLTAGAAFGEPVPTPAWKTKPSWAVVATEDRAINPELERFMTQRAGSKTIEVKASHAVYISQPQKVAKLIEEAAASVKP